MLKSQETKKSKQLVNGINNMPQCIWWCEAISDALHRISLYISFSIFNSGVSFFINRMQNHLFGCTSSITMRKSKSQDLIRLLAGTKSKKGIMIHTDRAFE